MKQPSLFVLILFICAALVPYFYMQLKPYFSLEGFQSYNLEDMNTFNETNGYPLTENNVLIQDSYRITGKNGVSDDQGSKIWWHYPIFKVGSFKQLTNNLV